MTMELKPCPFCGSPAQEYVDAGGIRNYFCTKCPCALSGDYEHHMTGRKAWNTRAEQASQHQWIPVSERLPKKCESVLVAAEFDGPGDWRIKVGGLDGKTWKVFGASWTPTHWMPLPDAPKSAI